MNIQGLQISDQKQSGQTYYEAAVVTVNGKSQYNSDQVSFKEIQNFWSLPQNYVYSDVPRTDDNSPMPDGTLRPGDVVGVMLNTNPKKGQNAKPGSVYYNIGSVFNPAGQQPVQAQPAQAPRDEWASDEYNGAGELVQSTRPHLTTEQRISKAQAWNGLTARLAGNNDWQGEQLAAAEADWQAGYEALKRGETPFTEQPEPAVESVEAEAPCPHANVVGVKPPHGGFKPGDATMQCTDCLEWLEPVLDQNGDPTGNQPRIEANEQVEEMPW